MSTPIVYLGGPISGESYEGATRWREQASIRLAMDGIAGVSPMRGKEFLAGERAVADHYDDVLCTPKAIVARDRFDVSRADVVLFNFAEADRVSIGSCIEIGWAHMLGKPIIAVMEEGNLHWHGMVLECAGFVVSTLDEALDLVEIILGV